MAIGDIVSDEDLIAPAGAAAPTQPSTPAAQAPGVFSDSDLDAMAREQEGALSKVNAAYSSSFSDSAPLRSVTYQASHGPLPWTELQPGPVRTLSSMELDAMEGANLSDPTWEPTKDQYFSAKDALHRSGGDTWYAGGEKMIVGMVQMLKGAINEQSQSTAPLSWEAQTISNVLEGGRKAMLGTVNTLATLGSALDQGELSINPGRPEEPPRDAEYNDFMEHQMVNREIAIPRHTDWHALPGLNQLPSPQENTSNLAAMVLAPENLAAGAAGKFIGPALGNASKAMTGRVFSAIGSAGIAIDDGIAAAMEGASVRLQNMTGLPPEMIENAAKGLSKAGYAGAGALGIGAGIKASGNESNPVTAALSPIVAYALFRNGATVFRGVSRAAQMAGAVFREASDPMGPLRGDAAAALASDAAIPKVYREALGGNAPGIDSTPSRIANNPALPDVQRRIAQKLANPAVVSTIRAVGAVGEGAATGALSTLPFMGMTSDQDRGGLIATGALFGSVGNMASRFVGDSVRMRQQDVARFLVDQKMLGGDPVLAASLGSDRLQKLAAFQGLLGMKGTDLVALNGADYNANRALIGNTGTAGIFLDAPAGQRPRLFVNLDAVAHSEGHEFAHAIMGSQVMDGTLRDTTRSWVQNIYGDEKVRAMGREYAKTLIEAEDRAGKDLAATKGIPFTQSGTPLEQRVDAKMAELSQDHMSTAMNKSGDPLDWARDEIFAEHINTSGLDINRVRQGLSAFSDHDAQVQSVLSAQARVLEAAGVPLDQQTGAPLQPISQIFKENPLVGSTPELQRQLAGYVKSYNGWLNGVSDHGTLGNPRGAVIAANGNPYTMARSKGVVLRESSPGVRENEFIREQGGAVTFKSQAEIDAAQKARDAQVGMLFDPKTVLPKSDPNLGVRTVDGKRVISGTRLPDAFDGLNKFGPWIRSLARTIEQGRLAGNTWNILYHRIGTGDSGSYKVINAGNTEAIRRNVLPFEWRVSNNNKLLMNVVDMTTLNAKALKALNKGKLDAFGNDLNAFHKDFLQYLDNHRQNLPGENGLGLEKRNVINGLLSPGTKINRSVNPLTGDFGPRGIIRSIRVDRLEDASMKVGPDGQPETGFHFDYDKVNANRMPEAQPYKGQAMPDVEAESSPLQLEYGRGVGRMRQTKSGKWQVVGPSGKPSTYPNYAKAISRSNLEVNLAKPISELKKLYGPEDRKALTAAEARIAEVAKNNPEAIRLVIARDDKTGLPKIDKLYDADGEPILNAKGKQERGVIFTKEKYGIRNAPGLSKDEATAVHQAADRLVNHTNQAIQDPSIAAGVGWYGRMRAFLQKNFGANLEIFGQLLGATSARTPVDTNFKQALEALRLFARGHYDELLERFATHINQVHADANSGKLLGEWLARSSKNTEGNFDLSDAVRKQINKFDEVPLREKGAKYNANSQKVLHALYGNWIEQTVGPKTPNFAGNLTGRTLKATIDVWAARNLRRLLYEGKVKRWRILPEQEQAVGSSYNKAGELTGDFPFAQKIYEEAAKRLGMNPDDLQALIWFAEKDVWEKNGWTNTVGAEKSSFDKEAGKLNMDRYQAGVTTFRQFPNYDPEVQHQERLKLRASAAQIPGLQAARITHSDGLYGKQMEPTFDVELSVQRNADGSAPSIAPFTQQIIDIAREHGQSDVFISQVVDINHPNARPMVEIGFKSPGKPEEVQQIIERFQAAGIDGFTISKDNHGKVLGIRSQYIPEISARFDGLHESTHLDPEQFANHADDWTDMTRKVIASLSDIDNISYKEEGYVSTHVYGKEEYTTATPADFSRSNAGQELGRRQRLLAQGSKQ